MQKYQPFEILGQLENRITSSVRPTASIDLRRNVPLLQLL